MKNTKSTTKLAILAVLAAIFLSAIAPSTALAGGWYTNATGVQRTLPAEAQPRSIIRTIAPWRP